MHIILQVLLSWEGTIAHAIPWETFNPWIQKNTARSRFIAAISAASIAYEHKACTTNLICLHVSASNSLHHIAATRSGRMTLFLPPSSGHHAISICSHGYDACHAGMICGKFRAEKSTFTAVD